MQKVSWLDEVLVASKEGLCSIELQKPSHAVLGSKYLGRTCV
jgi:hypothetical protein